MTGFERNADVVRMATYAPLFAHVEGWQWRPDMIWFDNLASVATASYYVQQLYAQNRGSRVVPLTLGGKAVTGAEGQNGLYASAAIDSPTGEYIVKIANVSDSPREITLDFRGLKKGLSLAGGRIITLGAPLGPDGTPDLDCDNTLDNPSRIVPAEAPLTTDGQRAAITLPAKTFAVCRLSVTDSRK